MVDILSEKGRNLTGSFRFFIVVFSFFAVALKGQTVNTIIGNGNPGFSGDGGLATAAEIYAPNGVALDDSGNVYVGDNLNNRIRKLNVKTGVITTIAGKKTGGFSGDGGPATDAELSKPGNITLDKQGNLYIADVFNQRVRMVNKSTGIITTIAGNGNEGYSGDGGQATAASFFYPASVALDNAGNVYVADELNNVIREVNMSTGIITTVAGSGNSGYSGDGGPALNASMNTPADVAFDSTWNMYISDGNNAIRKVNATTGIITTVAGNGTEGYGGDGGPATAAGIDGPVGIALDKSGDLFIADIDNSRIREASANGIINTVIGTGQAGFIGDGGPATACEIHGPLYITLDNSGGVYFADGSNNRVRKVTNLVGIENITDYFGVNIYPNPVVGGSFHLTFANKLTSYAVVGVYSVTGQCLINTELLINTQSIEIPVKKDIASGIYLLKILLADGSYCVKKLIIEN
ncbi:MAG TPA: T9SS type A sorting domain-containing protein [Bacteroidia bacterium]|nr:T9SS type A sorting domain-containing protein [Bacteroidia bacterium]